MPGPIEQPEERDHAADDGARGEQQLRRGRALLFDVEVKRGDVVGNDDRRNCFFCVPMRRHQELVSTDRGRAGESACGGGERGR